MTIPTPQQPALQPPQPQKRGSQTLIITLVSVLGGFILLGVIGALLLSFLSNRGMADQYLTAPVSNVRELDVEVAAGEFIVQFGSVDEATLDIQQGRGSWTLEQRGDTLVVESPSLGWLNFCFGWCESQLATLTLPNELQLRNGLDADLELSAGSLTASGVFNDLDLTVSAGEMRVDATAKAFQTTVSAGELRGTINGARQGEVQVSAGSTRLTLTGDAPDMVSVEVSAGNTELVLPEAAYDVRSTISAGELDNRLNSGASNHVVEVEVAAGGVTLRH